MKLILLLLLLQSTISFAQTDSTSIIGSWEYQTISGTDGPLIDTLNVKQFLLNLNSDGTFTMPSKEFEVLGTWSLEKEVLVLTGAPEGNEEKIQSLTIYSRSDSTLVFTIGIESTTQTLLNMKRIK